jgi:hypothetical protein
MAVAASSLKHVRPLLRRSACGGVHEGRHGGDVVREGSRHPLDDSLGAGVPEAGASGSGALKVAAQEAARFGAAASKAAAGELPIARPSAGSARSCRSWSVGDTGARASASRASRRRAPAEGAPAAETRTRGPGAISPATRLTAAGRQPSLVGETRGPRRVSTHVEEVPSAECPIVPGARRPSPRSGMQRTRHELGARGTGAVSFVVPFQ